MASFASPRPTALAPSHVTPIRAEEPKPSPLDPPGLLGMGATHVRDAHADPDETPTHPRGQQLPGRNPTAEIVHSGDGHVCFPPGPFQLGASPHRVRKMIEECQRLPTSDWCVWPCQSHITQHGHRFPTERHEVEMYYDQ